MKSSDERATAHLIAERTLALAATEQSAEAAPKWPRHPLVLLLVVALFVLGGGTLYLILGRGTQEGARPSSGSEVVGDSQGQGSGPTGDDGLLNCNAWPSARVYLDGKRLLGVTPINKVPVPPGNHLLYFVSRDGSTHKEVSLTVKKGEIRTVAISLER